MRSYLLHFILILVLCFTGICRAVCPVGDLNGDCVVGVDDLAILVNSWLAETSEPVNLDGLGKVDLKDLNLMMDHWGLAGYRLVLNEVMADNKRTIEDPDEPGEYPDWIEIYNPGSDPVDLAGMTLTDTLSTPDMWRIPAGNPQLTTVDPGKYLLLWADDDYTQGARHLKFKLSAGGEAVGLFDPNGHVVDSIEFDPMGVDMSYGRFPNGGPVWQWFAKGATTPGSSNGGDLADKYIIISEIMFHPAHNAAVYEPEPLEREYIELYNNGVSAVNLGGWRLVDGVTFDVPADTIIGAGEYLVIAANTQAFSSYYTQTAHVVGGWTGKLSNNGERITLVNTIGTVIDTVKYSDEGEWARRKLGLVDYNHRGWIWQDEQDSGGRSLEVECMSAANDYGQNWKASLVDQGTPGRRNSVAISNAAPFILEVKQSPVMPSSQQGVTVTVRIADEVTGGLTVNLRWRMDTSVYVKAQYPTYDAATYTTVVMWDDGTQGDGLAGDGVYGGVIEPQADGKVVEFFVEATDSSGAMRTWPAPCDVDGQLRQVANGLYLVNNAFAAETAANPDNQPIYYIIMTEAERKRLEVIGAGNVVGGVEERYSNAQMNGTFISADGVDTKIRYQTSFRNRGEGSRRIPPNNYRINFHHDDPWKEVTAININSKYTYLQVVGSAIERLAGVTAADATAVRVRVNGKNLALTDSNPARMYGLYAHLEGVNGEFAANHFPGDGDGNVYKASIYPQVADLTYQGANPASYVTRGFTKSTNVSENDWSDLFALTWALNKEPDATYLQRLNEVVNVDQWLRWYAVEVLIGNNETNLGNGYGDDYRMYRGVIDPRFVLVAHDNDTILGKGDSPSGYTDSIWRPFAVHSAVQMVVIQRFLQHPEFVGRYYAELKRVADTAFAPETIDPLLDNLLSGWVPEAEITKMKQFAANRRANVLGQIPQTFTATTTLTKVSGFYKTTTSSVAVSGTASVLGTRAVRVNGQPATWSGITGAWSTGSTVALKPGINRIIIQTYADPQGLGTVLYQSYLDVWYDDGTQGTLTGELASDQRLDAAGGPWHVTGNVVVPAGITLTIDPGATLFFDAGVGITVNGRLMAAGSDYARIRLTRVPGGSSWNGLAFGQNDTDSQLSCLDMDYGDGQGASIVVDNARLTLDKMTWAGTQKTIVAMAHPRVTLSRSVAPGTGMAAITGQYITGNDFVVMTGNQFLAGTTPEDIIVLSDADGGAGHVRLYDNLFYGGGGNGVTLNGVDGWLEGNSFANFHQHASRTIPAHAVSASQSDLWLVRNSFADNDHALQLQDQAWAAMDHGVVARCAGAAVRFGEEPGTASPTAARGMVIDSSIFTDNAALFDYPALPTAAITLDRSIVPAEWISGGAGNLDANPLFVSDSDFHLQAGSPAIGGGAGGSDMGCYVARGAILSGVPLPVTYQTEASIVVGGTGVTHYVWRLLDNGQWTGLWSEVTAVNAPITLTGLQNGHTYQVGVLSCNAAGDWLTEAQEILSTAWTVQTGTIHLVINEVLASNSALAHEGSYPDMIELYYDGAEPLELGGYRLSDNHEIPDKFVFDYGTIMQPGSWLTIYADSASTGGIHSGFALDADGDDLYLLDPAGIVLDSIKYGNLLANLSIGRIGHEGNWMLTEPTLGATNRVAATGDSRTLIISEWLANGDILFTEDWLELYNPDPRPVNLAGLYLTDDPESRPGRSLIAPLTFIGGQDYLSFTADGQGTVNFALSYDGGMIGLYDGQLNKIDTVIYKPAVTDVSQGRSMVSSDLITSFGLPTPGVSNEVKKTSMITEPLVALEAEWSYYQAGQEPGTGWYLPGFDDSGWDSGPALLYYDNDALPAPKNTKLVLGPTTYYFRRHFNFSGNPAEVDHLALTTVIDDGAVIYLNGKPVLPIRLTLPVTYDTKVTSSVGVAVFEYFNISAAELKTGDNVIAVEVHQATSTFTDIVFGLQVDAVVNDVWYEDGYDNDRAVLQGLRITEIMYNPDGALDSEFLELQNTGTTALNLEGVRLGGGIDFTFGPLMLKPGQFTVVVANRGEFETRYGAGINIAGSYNGRLSNGGEALILQLANPLDAAALRFEYQDGWYIQTDGLGYSLVVIDPAAAPSQWKQKEAWRPSLAVGGSPGQEDAAGGN